MSIPSVHAVTGQTPYTVTFTDDGGNAWLADEPVEHGGANAGPFG